MVDLSNFEVGRRALFDVSIVQNEIGGGKTGIEQLECLKYYPDARSLMVSGLNQESFEYLIEQFGDQFEAISFWKNKMISDLSPLSDLNNIKYIHFFFNQRAVDLWDMSHNENLEGLAVYDFSRLHTIEKVASAPHLDYFAVGNRAWSRMEIESLKPLACSSITHFAWYGNKVLDKDYLCLLGSRITELDMNIAQFKMDELARLVAGIPGLKGSAAIPYWKGSVTEGDKRTTYYFLCKGKKRLIKGKDDEKLERYLAEFDQLVETYRAELQEA